MEAVKGVEVSVESSEAAVRREKVAGFWARQLVRPEVERVEAERVAEERVVGRVVGTVVG
jgi:hypothetical protein